MTVEFVFFYEGESLSAVYTEDIDGTAPVGDSPSETDSQPVDISVSSSVEFAGSSSDSDSSAVDSSTSPSVVDFSSSSSNISDLVASAAGEISDVSDLEISSMLEEETTFFNKPFEDYTMVEGYLFLIFAMLVIVLVLGLRRGG